MGVIGDVWGIMKDLYEMREKRKLQSPPYEKETSQPTEKTVAPSEMQRQEKNFDLADLNEEQTRVMQNLALMCDNRMLPFEVRDWIGCDKSTLDELVNTGWLTRTEEGYEVQSIVRVTVLLDEIPVAAVEKFLRYVACGAYFLNGENSQTVQFKLKTVVVVLEEVGDRLEKSKFTATLYTKLGRTCYRQKEYTQAEKYFQKVLDTQLTILGEEHLDTAKSYMSLGVVCARLRRFVQAADYHKKALNIRRKKLGENDLDTAKSYACLGDVYRWQGDYAKAEECHWKVFYIRLGVLGDEHPDTAMSCYALGDTYEQQKKYDMAVKQYLRAWKIDRKKLGSEDLNTIMAEISLQRCFPHIDHGDQDFDTWLSQQ